MTITGTSSDDTLTGSASGDEILGLAGADILDGGEGNDTLDGGPGIDRLVGGADHDLYFISATGTVSGSRIAFVQDVVVENLNEGADTVYSGSSFTLPANVEHLVLTGAPFWRPYTGTGNDLDNTILGADGARDRLYGLDGNDVLDGRAGADRLDGGAGDDVLHYDAADTSINGGAGSDTLMVASGALDLTAIADAVIQGVEVIDLAGTNELTLDSPVVLNLSDSSNTLRVMGGAGDTVVADEAPHSGLWVQGGNVVINTETYAVYTKGAATLQVDVDAGRGGIEAYVPVIQLSALDGTNGFQLSGEVGLDAAGFSVSAAGDVNGDGFADLLIGSRNADPGGNYSGASHVVFGSASGFGADFPLTAVDGSNGFQINGAVAVDVLGHAVSGAGDVNGDGYDDIIVGAYGADPHGAASGASYVVFGGSGGYLATLHGSSGFSPSLLNGTNGFQLPGEGVDYASGRSVSAAGDVNGDGFADLLIGSQNADANSDYSGAAHVVFGRASGFAGTIELSALNGTDGFEIAGATQGEHAGYSASAAGDINGDGYDDVIVGAPNADPTGTNTGASYVVFGKASVFGAILQLSTLNGTNGFRISGEAANDISGNAVSAAGDVNGDGYGDLMVAARYADPNVSQSGASYVVFGKASGFTSNFNLSTLDGTNGFQLSGVATSSMSGWSVSDAGDVNGDGYDDVIVGAPGDRFPNDTSPGASYVVFGKASGFLADLNLSALNGTNGFKISGEAASDHSGYSVSAAGDVNGDGYGDLFVGAPGAPTGINPGAGYVIFGRDFSGAVDFFGTAGNDSLTGGSSAEVFVGGLGNDTMTGGGGADVFRGGAGDDRIAVSDASFLDVDGGTGSDTLALDGGGISLNLTALADSKLTGIEVIDLTGSGNNTLTLAALELLNLSDSSNTLRVDGNAGDAVVASLGPGEGAWGNAGTVNDYTEYRFGEAVLQVRVGIDVSGITAAVPVVQLFALDGTSGFQITGEAVTNDWTGFSVSSAGDVNRDGYADLIVGAPHVLPPTAPGSAYLVFGKSGGFSDVALSSLTGADGFQIAGGANSDKAGVSVSSAGDINGDGFADLIVGASGYAGKGAAYVVFGKSGGFSDINLSALGGADGFRITGEANLDYAGSSVSEAGDVNGDGFGDLIIGSYSFDNFSVTDCGAAYVVFGKSGGFTDFNLSTLSGSAGFQITGEANGDRAGWSVSSAGDMNGDGYGDLVVGAAKFGASNNGAAYVVFGKSSGFADFNLSTLSGASGFQITGAAANDYTGSSVSAAGDVNGDGFGDLIVSAYYTGNGAAYVVFGKSGTFSDIELSALGGASGFRITGEASADWAGFSVSSAGDVNGDGYDDVLVGARNYGASNPGAAYVVFGKGSGLADINLASLDGTNGFQVTGEALQDVAGNSVSSAGDVNGDGFDDLLVGAPQHDENSVSNNGAAWVMFGNDFNGVVDFAGTAGADALNGTASAEVFVAGADNDTLTGGGGADVFRGGAGDDRIVVPNTGFFDVDGGSGTDTLALAGSGISLDLTALADSKLTNIEVIDLTGSGNNTLTLDALEVLGLSGNSNTLRVDGNAGDRVITGETGWTRISDTTIGPNDYAQYIKGGATLQVDLDVDRESIVQAPVYALSALDGTNGFRLDGVANLDRSGGSVSAAGDLNGDGYSDLLIGAFSRDGSGIDKGASYVVFGGSAAYLDALHGTSGFSLSALAGTNGFEIRGEADSDYSGWSVSDAGDVNGDGFADVIVGAPTADPNGLVSGASYVVFGTASGFGANLELSALTGANGFQISGEGGASYDRSGSSVSGAGDVNGDGFADLIVGAPNADPNGNLSGASHVVFGKASGFAASLDLSALDGTNGLQIRGINASDMSGGSVASAGDVNGDGYDDVIVGSVGANAFAGASYVVFGGNGGSGGYLDTLHGTSGFNLSALDGTNGLRLNGIDGGNSIVGDYSGRSVASAGDVNGDGFSDLIVGAYKADPNGVDLAGESYVVFGGSGAYLDALHGTSGFNLSALNGTNGFRLDGTAATDFSGTSVASAGDVNGDGYDDLIIGATKADPNGNSYAGESFVMFGKASGFGVSLALSALDGANGFRLDGIDAGDHSGGSVAAAGDVNGDGYADLIIGAASANSAIGESYVLFGRDFTGQVDFLGTAGNDALTGTGAAESFVAGAGNDTLTGGGGADVFRGGAGDDRIVVPNSGFFDVDGGAGVDTLALVGSAISLNLTAIADSKVSGIEAIDLTGSGNNSLTLKLSDVLNLSDSTNTLVVEGNAGDSVTVSDGTWADGGTGVVPGYHQYTLGVAKLLIDTEIASVTITT